LQARIWMASRSAPNLRTSFEHLAPPIIPVLALIVFEKERRADERLPLAMSLLMLETNKLWKLAHRTVFI
jgi:hypothetical protein